MCNCNNNFDDRMLCWVNNKNWVKCPMRIINTLDRILNEYKYYKKIEEKGFHSLQKEIMKICTLTEDNWIELTELHNDQMREDEEWDKLNNYVPNN